MNKHRQLSSGIRLVLVSVLIVQACVNSRAESGADAVSLREQGGRLIISNRLVQYELDRQRGFEITDVTIGGTELAVRLKSAFLVYNEGGKWSQDSDKPDKGGLTLRRQESTGDFNERTVTVVSESERLRLTKIYTLRAQSEVLRVAYKLEPIAKHDVGRGYMPLFRVERDSYDWIRQENVVRDGRISREIAVGTWFKTEKGAAREASALVTVAGLFSADRKHGLLFVNDAASLLPLRAGEQKNDAYIGPRFQGLSAPLTATFYIEPFVGEPAPQTQRILEALKLEPSPLCLGTKPSTGQAVASGKDFALWWDTATNKVFVDEPVPQAAAKGVTLRAARGESESFQIVLRGNAQLAAVRLECAPLKSVGGEIAAERITWNPIAYYDCKRFVGSDGVVGEVPDALLPSAPVDCRADHNQPFWITVRVPEAVPAGDYQGQVKVFAGDKLLATIPVTLKVWDFALPKQPMLSTRLGLRRPSAQKVFGAGDFERNWDAMQRTIADVRAATTYLEVNSEPRWNDKDELEDGDFAPLDAALEKFFTRYSVGTALLSDFRLGYGHQPRANTFGKAEEILSERWKARCTSYARALSKHLREKRWNDKVIFFLFDEPLPEQIPLLAKTVSLLKEIDPAWRFTYWGNHSRELEGAINVWCLPMSSFKPSLAKRLRARGDTIWVYNPPGYRVDQSATAVRANYWWLWRNGVTGLLQWSINSWTEQTGDPAFDERNREASWLMASGKGFLSTVRMELTREGIEDYEYLAMLQRLTDEAQRGGLIALATEGRNALKLADAIAWTPPAEEMAVLYTQDSIRFEAARKKIGDAIEQLTNALRK